MASKLFKQRALSQRNSRQSTLKWNFRRFRIEISYQLKAVVCSFKVISAWQLLWESETGLTQTWTTAAVSQCQYCIIRREQNTPPEPGVLQNNQVSQSHGLVLDDKVTSDVDMYILYFYPQLKRSQIIIHDYPRPFDSSLDKDIKILGVFTNHRRYKI